MMCNLYRYKATYTQPLCAFATIVAGFLMLHFYTCVIVNNDMHAYGYKAINSSH